MTRYNAPGEILPYTDRKASSGDADIHWANETERGNDIVEAMQRHCRGETIDQIAAAMQLPHHVIRQFVAPDDAQHTKRAERATVGFAHMKGRR